jgi:hypothetical protein
VKIKTSDKNMKYLFLVILFIFVATFVFPQRDELILERLDDFSDWHITIIDYAEPMDKKEAEEKPHKDAGSFKKNRVSIAYGFASVLEFAFGIGLAFGSIFADYEEEIYTSFGPLSLTYDRNISKHCSFGVVFAYANFASKRTWEDGETERIEDNLLTLMLKLGLRWGWEVVSFYHGISIGATLFLTETDDSSSETVHENHVTPALHIYFVGLNINVGDTVSLFGDVGLGSLGMMNIGLAFKY